MFGIGRGRRLVLGSRREVVEDGEEVRDLARGIEVEREGPGEVLTKGVQRIVPSEREREREVFESISGMKRGVSKQNLESGAVLA